MRRDRLLLTEIVEAVERITGLTNDRSLDDFGSDRDRRDALLWNFTVLGEGPCRTCSNLLRRRPLLNASCLTSLVVRGETVGRFEVLRNHQQRDVHAVVIMAREVADELVMTRFQIDHGFTDLADLELGDLPG